MDWRFMLWLGLVCIVEELNMSEGKGVIKNDF